MDTVGRNRKKIEESIRNQLREDEIADQLSLFEEYEPFAGQKNPKKNKRSFYDQWVKVVQRGNHSEGLWSWTVIEAFSCRENHQFVLVLFPLDNAL